MPFDMHDFMLREDTFMFLTDWIDLPSVGILDVAIADRMSRVLWLQHLRTVRISSTDKWHHGHSSLRWLITRGIQASRILMDYKYVRQITDLTFEGIKIGDLTCIDLISCIHITDAGIKLIADGCPLLTTIVTLNCPCITDGCVSALVHGCPLLKTISLEHCSNITDDGVSALVHGCPLLKIISLGCCDKISDVGVLAVARGCPLLQEIYLNNCNGITFASIPPLAHGCPLLTDINLSYSCRFSKVEVYNLESEFPKLSIEYFQAAVRDDNDGGDYDDGGDDDYEHDAYGNPINVSDNDGEDGDDSDDDIGVHMP